MTRISLVFLFCAAALHADVRLPNLISSGMMLQRDVPARIWGQADPGEEVTVRFRDQSAAAKADELGRWSVHLKPSAAGGPFEMRIQGRNSIVLNDVLVGDVWVASGQSNMEWEVERSRDAAKEIAAANYPRIRFFRVAHKVSDVPLDEVTTPGWKAVTPETIAPSSAVAYYFARHLHGKLNVPVGIIQAAWGGTPADAWTSYSALAADPGLMPVFTEWSKAITAFPAASARHAKAVKDWEANGKQGNRPAVPQGPGHQWQPAGLYNGMIAPLVPYAIRGVIWYQGESNAGAARAPVYHRLFSTMIRDWRQAWGQGDFPFLFVQLANYGKTGPGSQWPELREAQLQTLALRNTGMAVTVDIGDPADIHPTNKQDVGLRLALAARAIAYGEKLEYSGPIFRNVTREGRALRVWFDHAESGLKTQGGDLQSVEVQGPDGWVPAAARVEGSTLVVSSPEVEEPRAVRYAWADAPDARLYNGEGLPASPFRVMLDK